MPEIHLRQSGYTYSACWPFTKNKENTKIWRNIYQGKLDKACFHHGISYGDFNSLPKRTASDKVLCDKAFNIAKNPKFEGCQCGFASMVYTFFDKMSVATRCNTFGGAVKSESLSDQQLSKELHKPIILKM